VQSRHLLLAARFSAPEKSAFWRQNSGVKKPASRSWEEFFTGPLAKMAA
jgi:hypothetical protein